MMTGAVAGASELDVPAALEDPVEVSFGQVWIMENVSPSGKGLVGGEEHGLAFQVPLIHDLEEDVGCVVPETEVAQ